MKQEHDAQVWFGARPKYSHLESLQARGAAMIMSGASICQMLCVRYKLIFIKKTRRTSPSTCHATIRGPGIAAGAYATTSNSQLTTYRSREQLSLVRGGPRPRVRQTQESHRIRACHPVAYSEARMAHGVVASQIQRRNAGHRAEGLSRGRRCGRLSWSVTTSFECQCLAPSITTARQIVVGGVL